MNFESFMTVFMSSYCVQVVYLSVWTALTQMCLADAQAPASNSKSDVLVR